MNVSEMMVETYRQLGKPSYLNPYAADGETLDIGTAGAQDMLRWINRGYKRILTWRFPSGKIIRFNTAEQAKFFKSVVVEGTAQAGSSMTITLAATTSDIADRYKSWLIEIVDGTGAGQRRMIVSYSNLRVATVHKSWDVSPDATSQYKMTKNFYLYKDESDATAEDNISLNPIDEVITVLSIEDLESGGRLVRADRTDTFTDIQNLSKSVPTVFSEYDGGVSFNSAVDDERYFKMKYIGFPAPLAELTDKPMVPPQFHEAVLLWTIWWGLKQMQETDAAYSTKRDLEDCMTTAMQQYDRANEREDIFLYIGE